MDAKGVFPAKAGNQNACTGANFLRAAELARPAPIICSSYSDSKVTWSEVPGFPFRGRAGKTKAALPIFNNRAASHVVSIPLGSPSTFTGTTWQTPG